MLGNIKFIGELAKLELLHEAILHRCIQQLLSSRRFGPPEEDLECLCQIMRTVGRRLDKEKARAWMDKYFERIKVYKTNPELPSRIRFMLQDVVELRGNKWVPRKILRENAPKTIQQVRHEAAREFGIHVANPSTNAHMMPAANMDLFGRPLNNGSVGSHMPDMFGHMPAFMTGGPGVGPGTIHIDNFATGYNNRRGGGGNRGGRGGYRRQDNDMEDKSLNDQQSRSNGRKDQDGRGGDQSYYRSFGGGNNRDGQFNNRDGQFNNRDNYQKNFRSTTQTTQQTQKDLAEKLPPRFRKQLQMQNPSAEMNGVRTPPRTSSPPQSQQPQMSNKTNEEINLRPANLRNFTPTFRPNIPSMLPKSTQIPQQMPRQEFKQVIHVPEPAIIQPAQITIKRVSSADTIKEPPKQNQLTEQEVKQGANRILADYLEAGEVKQALTAVLDLKPPKKYLPQLVCHLIVDTLDKTDNERENVSELLKLMKEEELLTSTQFLDGFSLVLIRMKDLDSEVPLVKSSLARYAAAAVSSELLSLPQLAQPMHHGAHYPLFLLCLQQLNKMRDNNWLVNDFNKANINLKDMLPESEQWRLMEILEDRGLTFLLPLLRVQSELKKQMALDPSATALYKWIRDSVQQDLYTDPGFITILITSIVKYVSGESTLKQDTAATDKGNIEHEKDLLSHYKDILGHFLQNNLELQIIAIYAMQVFVHNAGFPKGLLLRLFVQMYENEVIDEEAFVKWKEEVNDQYPGKGKALFQVNTWLTWLEQAESESSDDGEDDE